MTRSAAAPAGPSRRLTRSREDYLKALYDLDAGAPVPVSVLARRLAV